MNLLIIPSWYPSKGRPMNGIFFREQALALAKKGHHVTVIDVSFQGRKDTFNSKNFRFTFENDGGLHVYSFKIPSLRIITRNPSLYMKIYKMLLFYVFKKVIKREAKFDIIHAHSFYPAGYCACDLSRKYKIPLVITEHSTRILEGGLTPKEITILGESIENCAKYICVSESLCQYIENLFQPNEKLIVIPNMFSSDFEFLQKEKKQKDEFLFLSIGFLNERKRHGFAIECFMEAFNGMQNVKFQIIGSGDLYNNLQKQIKDNGLSEQVQLLGSLDKKQLIQKLEDCDCFVLSSIFENFGVVYVEAMACGKPVIAARNGGANGIVNDTNGILIDKDNKEQLVAAFKYMFHNAEKYDNKQIASDCHAKYSEDAVTEALYKIYRNVETFYEN